MLVDRGILSFSEDHGSSIICKYCTARIHKIISALLYELSEKKDDSKSFYTPIHRRTLKDYVCTTDYYIYILIFFKRQKKRITYSLSVSVTDFNFVLTLRIR